MPKLLLDENLPKKLKYRFGESYVVVTIPEMGWSSLKDNELLRAIQQSEVDYLITADKNLIHQQNSTLWAGIVIVLDTHDNQYETLLPLIDKIKQAIESSETKDFHWLTL